MSFQLTNFAKIIDRRLYVAVTTLQIQSTCLQDILSAWRRLFGSLNCAANIAFRNQSDRFAHRDYIHFFREFVKISCNRRRYRNNDLVFGLGCSGVNPAGDRGDTSSPNVGWEGDGNASCPPNMAEISLHKRQRIRLYI